MMRSVSVRSDRGDRCELARKDRVRLRTEVMITVR